MSHASKASNDNPGFITWRGSSLTRPLLDIVTDEPTTVTVPCGIAPLSEIKVDGLRALCRDRGLKPKGLRHADLIAILHAGESQD